MRFGLLVTNQHLPCTPVAERFAETIAQVCLARDRFIPGDPDACAAEIKRCVEATGATTMLCRVHWPGMPHEVITQAMRLLAEKVRPQLT